MVLSILYMEHLFFLNNFRPVLFCFPVIPNAQKLLQVWESSNKTKNCANLFSFYYSVYCLRSEKPGRKIQISIYFSTVSMFYSWQYIKYRWLFFFPMSADLWSCKLPFSQSPIHSSWACKAIPETPEAVRHLVSHILCSTEKRKRKVGLLGFFSCFLWGQGEEMDRKTTGIEAKNQIFT